VKFSTNCTIQNHRNCYAGCSHHDLCPLAKLVLVFWNGKTHSRNCLSPAQAHSQNTRGCLPSSKIDRIRSPVSHPSPHRPRLILQRYRIHIGVRPDMIWSQSRFLLWQLPCRDRGAALLELLPRRYVFLGEVLHLVLVLLHNVGDNQVYILIKTVEIRMRGATTDKRVPYPARDRFWSRT